MIKFQTIFSWAEEYFSLLIDFQGFYFSPNKKAPLAHSEHDNNNTPTIKMSLFLITHAVINAFDGNNLEVPLRSVYAALSQPCTDNTVLLQSGIRANQHWQQLPGTHSRTAPSETSSKALYWKSWNHRLTFPKVNASQEKYVSCWEGQWQTPEQCCDGGVQSFLGRTDLLIQHSVLEHLCQTEIPISGPYIKPHSII